MHSKGLGILFMLLIAEAIAIFYITGSASSGFASRITSANNSSVSLILILVFVVTLVSILLSIKLIRDAHHVEKTNKETKLSNAILQKSFSEHKNKSQIERELLKSGYQKNEIEEFFRSWEDDEHNARDHQHMI